MAVTWKLAFTPHGNERDLRGDSVPERFGGNYVSFIQQFHPGRKSLYQRYLVATTIFPMLVIVPAALEGGRATSENALGNDIYGMIRSFKAPSTQFGYGMAYVSQRYSRSAVLGFECPGNEPGRHVGQRHGGFTVVITGTEQDTVTVSPSQTGARRYCSHQRRDQRTSGNPAVLTVNSTVGSGGVGVGDTTVSATVSGIPPPAAASTSPPRSCASDKLASDATDSVGGAKGTIVAPGNTRRRAPYPAAFTAGQYGGGSGIQVGVPAQGMSRRLLGNRECWGAE